MASLFKTPKPVVPKTPEAPTVDDAAVMAARKRAIAAQAARSGRASTMLTPPGGADKLGG